MATSTSSGINGVFQKCLLFVFCMFVSTVKSECQGPRGNAGPAGPPGSHGNGTADTWYDISPARNWRQCVWELSDSADSGTIATCSFTKQSSSTSLFVSYGGTTRLSGCSGCCGRWYFTFDDAECSSPDKIEGVVYMANYAGADLHRFRTIQGYCNGLSAGNIDVKFLVGNCASYGSADRHTGWNSVSRIMIEEVPASPYG